MSETNTEAFIKIFPPPDEMVSNIHIMVEIPTHLWEELSQLPETFETIKHAIFSVAEQEINIHTFGAAKVDVVLMEKKANVTQE